MGLIYAVRQLSNNKIIYIGSSSQYLSNRICTHRFLSEKYPNRKLYKYVRENGGWSQFAFDLLEDIGLSNKVTLRSLEKTYIRQYEGLCNLYEPISSREEYLEKKILYHRTKEGCIKKPWMVRAVGTLEETV